MAQGVTNYEQAHLNGEVGISSMRELGHAHMYLEQTGKKETRKSGNVGLSSMMALVSTRVTMWPLGANDAVKWHLSKLRWRPELDQRSDGSVQRFWMMACSDQP